MIKKFMKNTSIETQTVVNITIPPGSIVELEPSMWAKVQSGDFLISRVKSGIIVMNDGISDLSPQDGISLIYKWQDVTVLNEHYPIIATYNGKAGVGKYLEFFPGQGSNENPFPIPDESLVRVVTISAASVSTGTISLYKNFDLDNPILEVSISNSKYIKHVKCVPISADDRITCKVTSGSIHKPNVVIFIQIRT